MIAQHLRGFNKLVALLVCACLAGACSAQLTSVEVPALPASATAPLPSATPTITTLPPTETIPPPTLTPEPSLTPTPSPTADLTAAIQGVDLVAALRRGGYVIYLRHGKTDYEQSDASPLDYQDCTTQRNLSDQGRLEMREIGKAFVTLDIPVSKVLSSAYCRTYETALLAFGQVEVNSDLTGFPLEESDQRVAALRAMLAEPPADGSNTVLVAHDSNLSHAEGILLQEGEMAVFAPLGPAGYTLVARVLPEQWPELEQLSADLVQEDLANNPDLLLPDLQPLLPADLLILINADTSERQLRFTTSIRNYGPGVLEVWGYSDPTSGRTIVVQHIFTSDQLEKRVVVGEFIFHPEHDHWHLGNFARYEVWSLGADRSLQSRVGVTDKVSYCLRDDIRTEPADTDGPQTYIGCNQQRQGITPGWVDVYRYDLPGQSIDITDLPDGTYALLNIIDPDDLLWDLDRTNNTSLVYLQIEGVRVTVVE